MPVASIEEYLFSYEKSLIWCVCAMYHERWRCDADTANPETLEKGLHMVSA